MNQKYKPNIRNRYILIGDIGLILISVFGSYVLRLELGPAFTFYLPSAFWMLGISLLISQLFTHFLVCTEGYVLCQCSKAKTDHCCSHPLH